MNALRAVQGRITAAPPHATSAPRARPRRPADHHRQAAVRPMNPDETERANAERPRTTPPASDLRGPGSPASRVTPATNRGVWTFSVRVHVGISIAGQ